MPDEVNNEIDVLYDVFIKDFAMYHPDDPIGTKSWAYCDILVESKYTSIINNGIVQSFNRSIARLLSQQLLGQFFWPPSSRFCCPALLQQTNNQLTDTLLSMLSLVCPKFQRTAFYLMSLMIHRITALWPHHFLFQEHSHNKRSIHLYLRLHIIVCTALMDYNSLDL